MAKKYVFQGCTQTTVLGFMPRRNLYVCMCSPTDLGKSINLEKLTSKQKFKF